jgi:3-hydroxyisobutyrate dehydrogenase
VSDIAVGFVGLGAMGRPMALNLHRAGLLAAVFNRSPARSEALAAATGATAAPDLAALGRRCNTAVLCVPADADVLAAVDQLAEALPGGALVIDCSPVAAATARAAAATLASSDIEFLDCPVSGGTEGAKAATLSIMVGGEKAALERARPVLEAMGRSIVHLGPAGAGQAAKATNQVMVAGINQAVTEALAFGEAHGLPMDALIRSLSGGAAGNWFLEHRGATMTRGEYPLGFKVELHAKDLEICRAMAGSLGTQLPLVEMTLVHYRRLIEAGHGAEDISSLFRLKAAMFGDGRGRE